MFFYVFFGDTTIFATAFDFAGIQTFFRYQTAHRRAQRIITAVISFCFAVGFAVGFVVRFRFGFAVALGWCCTGFQLTNHLFGLYGRTGIFQNVAHHAIGLSDHFQYHFISFNVDQHLVTGHSFTRLNMPGCNGCISNGFRKYGYLNVHLFTFCGLFRLRRFCCISLLAGCRRGFGISGGFAASTQGSQHLLCRHSVAFLVLNGVDHTVIRCRHFQHNFIGFNVDHNLITTHGVAFRDMPLGNSGISDGLWQYRYFNICHCFSS